MDYIVVSPSEIIDVEHRVALNDVDPAHFGADEQWKEKGGVYFAGDPKNPGKSYRVANTLFVQKRIKEGFLVKVANPKIKDKI